LTTPSILESLLLQNQLRGQSFENPMLSVLSLPQQLPTTTFVAQPSPSSADATAAYQENALIYGSRTASLLPSPLPARPRLVASLPRSSEREPDGAPSVDPQQVSTQAAAVKANDSKVVGHGGKRKKRKPPFPTTLLDLLTEAEGEGKDGIISFTPSGMAFRIHRPAAFEKEIIPRYFRTKKIDSFKRQLGIYGFDRIPFGPDEGAFTHSDFRRGRRDLAEKMRPIKPGSSSSRPAWKPDFSEFWEPPF
jgi:hypothetical protein